MVPREDQFIHWTLFGLAVSHKFESVGQKRLKHALIFWLALVQTNGGHTKGRRSVHCRCNVVMLKVQPVRCSGYLVALYSVCCSDKATERFVLYSQLVGLSCYRFPRNAKTARSIALNIERVRDAEYWTLVQCHSP